MADVICTGQLMCSDGSVIPLLRSDLAEGTAETVSTDAVYTVAASGVGDYGPGKVVTHADIQTLNGVGFAYILRQGLILTILPVSVLGTSGNGPYPLCTPVRLQAGDLVYVMAVTATARTASISCYTASGVYRIFSIATANGDVEPVDIITGNSLGNTLQGDRIVKAFCTAGPVANVAKIDSGGALALNEKGMPIGVIPCNSPINGVVEWSSCNIPVQLNYTWRIASTS